MRLAEKHQYREVIHSIYCMFALHTGHWFEDVVNEIPYAKESIKGNAQMGDFEYACYGYYGLMMAVLESAVHVEELWNEVQAGVKFAEKTGSDHALGSFLSYQQLCRSIRGELSLTGSFDGDGFSEQAHLEQFFPQSAGNQLLPCHSGPVGSDLPGLFHGLPAVQGRCASAPVCLKLLQRGASQFPVFLSICQVLEIGDYEPEAKPILQRTLEDNQDWLKERSSDAFCNYGHLYLVIEAERKAAKGCIGEALRLYEEALEAADNHDRSLHHAILSDVAALRYERLGIKSAARHYLTDTYRLYGHWGRRVSAPRCGRTTRSWRAYGRTITGRRSSLKIPSAPPHRWICALS